MSKSDNWEDYAETWTPRKTKIWVAVILIVLIVTPAIGWGIHVATSGVKGQGDQIVHNNEEVNRTGKQEMFETLYSVPEYLRHANDIEKALWKLGVYRPTAEHFAVMAEVAGKDPS